MTSRHTVAGTCHSDGGGWCKHTWLGHSPCPAPPWLSPHKYTCGASRAAPLTAPLPPINAAPSAPRQGFLGIGSPQPCSDCSHDLRRYQHPPLSFPLAVDRNDLHLSLAVCRQKIDTNTPFVTLHCEAVIVMDVLRTPLTNQLRV